MLKGNNVVLIAVGDELIAGLKKEANISWLSAELMLRGQDVVAMEVIPDQEEVLVDMLDRWAGRVALIVISGGLGPTHDDRTREAIAKFLGLPLVAEKNVYDRIISRYPADLRESLERSGERQAYIPSGAQPIFNPLGSALGFSIDFKGTKIFALPGVPQEFREMARVVLDFFKKDDEVCVGLCKVVGWPEIKLKDHIANIIREFPANVMFLPEPNVVTVAIKGPKHIVATLQGKLMKLMKGDILPENASSLEDAVVKLASKLNISLAFAESCTGGMVGESVTRIPGASSVFAGSAVCYSNEAKEAVLGVPREVIEQFGAVSEECAVAMARGAANIFKANCSASVTGIAGPSGGSERKPVGTVCFAVTCFQRCKSWTRHLQGDRETIRLWSNNIALEAVWRELKDLAEKSGRNEGSN